MPHVTRRACLAVSVVVGAMVGLTAAGSGSQAGGAGAPAGVVRLGADLAGWEFVADPPTAIATVCAVKPDGVVAVTGTPIGYLETTTSHRDYRLHAEWRWTGKPGNSGALVHITGGPKDRQWPVCFQVQWKNTAVGDLLPMAGASFAEALSTPPGAKTPQLNRSGADSERPVGEWNACDITCRGSAIAVVVNGVAQNAVTGASVAEGRVGFQFEGTPFELRNVSIVPLGK